MVTSVDERPILLCRVDVPPHLQKELDDWSPEHFDDFGRHPTVQAVSSYKLIRDFDPVKGLPAAFNATQATRFIGYVCLDIPSMHEWVGSDIVTGGLDEPTLEREGKYPPIAEEPFNGTMLTVQAVRGALGTDHPGRGGIVAERWEVGSDRAAEFDGWLEGHLSRYEALDGWVRLRSPRRPDGRAPLPVEPLSRQGQPDGARRASRGRRPEGVRAHGRLRRDAPRLPPMGRRPSVHDPGESGSASSSRTSATSPNPAGSHRPHDRGRHPRDVRLTHGREGLRSLIEEVPVSNGRPIKDPRGEAYDLGLSYFRGELSRRTFLRRAAALSMSTPVVTAFLAGARPGVAMAQDQTPNPDLTGEISTISNTGAGAESQAWNDRIDAFLALYPNVTVKRDEHVGETYYQTSQAALRQIAGGVPPDTLRAGDYFAAQLAAGGALLPLDDLIANDASLNWEDFLPAARDSFTLRRPGLRAARERRDVRDQLQPDRVRGSRTARSP